MARYGYDFGAGYRPQGGGINRYDHFHYGPRQQGRGRHPGMGDWGEYSGGRERGGRGFGPYGPGGGRDFGHGGNRMGGGMGAAGQMDRQSGAAWGGASAADDVLAADIMTPNPEAVTPDTTLSEVAARMRDLDVGIIPVVDDLDQFHLQGVITDRDIAVRAAAEAMDMKQVQVADLMTKDVQTVRENDHVREVFTVMKRARVRRVPVTSEDGKLVGIIAQADLAVSYAGLDLQREAEVEEVIERISEPARPKWGAHASVPTRSRPVSGGTGYDRWRRGEDDLGERMREGWDWVRREARHLMGRGYDRGWRR